MKDIACYKGKLGMISTGVDTLQHSIETLDAQAYDYLRDDSKDKPSIIA